MCIFLRGIDGLIEFEKTDVVMDIGCGSGELAQSIKAGVKEIYCLDVSEHSINICRRRFASCTNVHIRSLDPHNYTSLEFLPSHRFTKIICLSVVQYYKNIDELKSLLLSIQNIAAPKAQILIADIPGKGHSLVGDIKGNLLVAWREGYLLAAIKLLIQAATGKYRQVRNAQGMFSTTKEELLALTTELNLNGTVVTKQISTNANRLHLSIDL
jgi:2-polyprenyl-3-methyl-5-hydroxy-6-metoxy-1,4-benzoquinol methylase